MKVGILFPRSNAHPLMGSSYLDALKLYLKTAYPDNDIELLAESIGFGGVEKEVYAKAEKLMVVDDVDILIGFIDEKILELIKPLLLASDKLMIVINPGANHSKNWIPQQNIVHLGLQHALLCAVTGLEAASSGGEVKAGMASIFYDCGYMHLAAMFNEFIQSKGIIQFNYINNQTNSESFHINELIAFLESKADTTHLLCIYDSKPADLFYQKLQEYPKNKLQLYVSPMMLESTALQHLGEGFNFSVHGFIPWHTTVPSDENSFFVNAVKSNTKKEATIFSLLGWETGMLLQLIAQKSNGDIRNVEGLLDLFSSATCTSPRGELYFDRETNYFVAPAIRCNIEPSSATIQMEYDIDMLPYWEQFIEKNTEGAVSGWTNTYLCY